MRILAVIGSPREGNTYKVVKQMEEDMKKCGDGVEFEYLLLKDVNLEPCKGCFACVSKGEQCCPIKDEAVNIIEKMKAADGIIFSSPVYAFAVSALMKNFIDRIAYISHRPCFFGKYAMAVVTSCGGGIPETLKYMESVTRSWGFTFVRKHGVMVHPSVKVSQKSIDNAKQAAGQFYEAIKTKKSNVLRFADLVQFRMMKFNAMESKSYFSADYEFYKEKKDYYINTNINVFKNAIAGMLEKLIIKMIGSNA